MRPRARMQPVLIGRLADQLSARRWLGSQFEGNERTQAQKRNNEQRTSPVSFRRLMGTRQQISRRMRWSMGARHQPSCPLISLDAVDSPI
jgi:hypothetical protein